MIKRLPWLRALKKTDPEPPVRLPIACGPVSNGEGWWPDSARKRLIRKLVLDKAEQVSRREGVDRREFLASACGMATSLYMINLVNGCSSGKDKADMRLGMDGGTGDAGMLIRDGGGGSGGYNICPEAMEDPECAAMALGDGGNELIVDMQSHFASPETNPLGALGLSQFVGQINNERFPWIIRSAGVTGSQQYDRTEYVNQIFEGSDTTIGVLSGISYAVGAGGMGTSGFAALSNEDLIDGVAWLEEKYPGRMLSHAMVMPNDRLEVQMAMMERLANDYTNWKTYPPWSPSAGTGYWLDGPEGQMMIQKGIDLGSPIFCIHKGFPLSGFSPTHTDPKDVGPAANMFPEAHFVIYHSAFEHGLAAGESTQADPANPMADVGWGEGTGVWPEGPYNEDLEGDEDAATSNELGGYPLNRGVNSLIWSLRKAGIGPNGTRLSGMPGPCTNVYAECGGTWPTLLVGRVEEAMHYWGKLLKYIGEDRIVWGTDCLWFGSPQPVIQAFRAFEISEDFQTRYGYPALTQARKEKILGQNAARLQNTRLSGLGGTEIMGCHSDYLSSAQLIRKRELDLEWGGRRDMMFGVPGPRTRREFLSLRSHEHNEKVRLSGNVGAWSRRKA